jgi:hypothetical protein
MSSTTTISMENASGTSQVNPWLIGVVVSLAAFMEVLDTSIANVALPHIAGSMGASNDESTWVLTSYLVSNAIVLPLSGFLVGLLGRKRFFLICISFFTVKALNEAILSNDISFDFLPFIDLCHRHYADDVDLSFGNGPRRTVAKRHASEKESG